MSFPSGEIWNCRSGFGICLRHTTTLRATANARRKRTLFQASQVKGRIRTFKPASDSTTTSTPMDNMELARNRIRPFVERARQFSGWRLDEFDPKPLEPQPPWDYETRAIELIRAANSVLDMGTGGGELLDALTASFFGRSVAT